ncbi:MAG TPA: nickel pincer cofactor biosynthesis protein LarB [Thermoplasmata archaeon]|nr:nickel pincer cofactor biosynthesis protein LarB [Thermoplasmata archaeon]
MRRARGSSGAPAAELLVPGVARIDLDRPRRTGVPEVILAEGKRPEELLRIVLGLRDRGLGALVSRPSARQRAALAKGGVRLEYRAHGRIGRLAGPLAPRPSAGPIALLAAGTSDLPIAEEAQAVLEALGARVVTEFDVGVAGLHRLIRAIARTEAERPELYLVFAGREGALPTVVAGLVRAPVVGVPTSIGYGKGGRGHAALAAMLQSCAPIAVVNIDGGVPAALFALQLLARRSDGRPTPRPARPRRRPAA